MIAVGCRRTFSRNHCICGLQPTNLTDIFLFSVVCFETGRKRPLPVLSLLPLLFLHVLLSFLFSLHHFLLSSELLRLLASVSSSSLIVFFLFLCLSVLHLTVGKRHLSTTVRLSFIGLVRSPSHRKIELQMKLTTHDAFPSQWTGGLGICTCVCLYADEFSCLCAS